MATPDTWTLSEEIFKFLVSTPSLEEITALQATPEMQLRLRYLLDANRNETLNDNEKRELDYYQHLDHFVRRLKILAQEILQEQNDSHQ